MIGVLAFLMAFPFFLRLLFAQPKIGLSFLHDDSGGEGRVIKVCLSNLPLNNKILRFIKISRLPAQDVYIAIEVYDSTKKLIDKTISEIDSSRSMKVDRITLLPSTFLTNVTLAKWNKSNKTMILVGSKLIPLQQGDYKFVMRLGLEGELKKLKPVILHVGKTEAESDWDKSVADKIWIVR